MSGKSILSADMTTIIQWLRSGLAWWIDELAALWPGAGSASGRSRRGPAALFDGAAGFKTVSNGVVGGALSPGGKPRHLPVLIDVRHILVREMQLPAMSSSDLKRSIALNGDRLMPVHQSAMLISARITKDRTATGKMLVELAGMPVKLADTVLNACRAFGIEPTGIAVSETTDPSSRRFEFLEAVQDAGLLRKTPSRAAIWWSITGFLVFLAILLAIERDAAARDHLQQLVDEQQPSVSAAHRIGARIETADSLVTQWQARSQQYDALGVLALTSAYLPDASWVQRFSWEKNTLRVVGYQRAKVDVLSALKRAPGFRNAHSTSPDMVAESAAGQPFDITITGAN